jgi:hypothetical protein
MSLRPSIRRPGHATVVAYLALGLTMTGTAYAATGGTFILGKANRAGVTTALTNRGTGVALRLNAHNLKTPVLSVGRNHTHIHNLNADYLDGLTSSKLQRRVTGTCGAGRAISLVRATGRVSCGPRIMWAQVAGDGTLVRGASGVTASRTAEGEYAVIFPVNVAACGFVATPGDDGSATPAAVTTWVAPLSTDAHGVVVETQKWGNADFTVLNEPFHLVVVC